VLSYKFLPTLLKKLKLVNIGEVTGKKLDCLKRFATPLPRATVLLKGEELHCVVCNNTVFGSKRPAICAQAVYFLHLTMPSVTCLRLSDAGVICRVTYFQFPIHAAFSMSIRQAAQRRTWFTQYLTSHVAENLRRYLYCTERRVQGNDFELILTVKMKTTHPVEGLFGSEFLAICNYCVVMAA